MVWPFEETRSPRNLLGTSPARVARAGLFIQHGSSCRCGACLCRRSTRRRHAMMRAAAIEGGDAASANLQNLTLAEPDGNVRCARRVRRVTRHSRTTAQKTAGTRTNLHLRQTRSSMAESRGRMSCAACCTAMYASSSESRIG
ncbi:hypothetical protein BVI434_1230033 [Burkholderia vietnamiensis]|nr:hypothetical protein BVI434_1230033 [Burkholderia vietnamiensis]